MGVGHVPQEPLRATSPRAQFQGSQYRRVAESRSVNSAARIARGKWAENLATNWYEHHGYRVVARNWRCPRGELDVVAIRGHELVVCEVKARASVAFGTPAEAITSTKQLRLRRATAALLAELRADKSMKIDHVRFDVACVLGTQLEIIMDAF